MRRRWRGACVLGGLWRRLVASGGAALALGALAADGDVADWRLRHHDELTDTRVYVRERADGTPAFRAVTRMRARLSALTAVVMDAPRMHEWVYRTASAQRLEKDGPTRGVSLVVTAMPWPLWDREAIVSWALTQDPATGAVTLAGHSTPDRLPPPVHRVRMPSFESRWRFVPLEQGEVEVSFEGHADLGGNLAWPPLRAFVAASAWEAPLYTIDGLRRMVQRPIYQSAQLPFIREPAP